VWFKKESRICFKKTKILEIFRILIFSVCLCTAAAEVQVLVVKVCCVLSMVSLEYTMISLLQYFLFHLI